MILSQRAKEFFLLTAKSPDVMNCITTHEDAHWRHHPYTFVPRGVKDLRNLQSSGISGYCEKLTKAKIQPLSV